MKNEMDIIDDLIARRYHAADGTVPDVVTRAVVIDTNLAGMERDAIRGLGFDTPLALVSDPDTHRVLGQRVDSALRELGPVIPVRLDASPHADMATAEKVTQATREARAIVAVGSGTINDLCKYAAAKNNIECAVFATAPSMNGYTSLSSAITVNGHKKSLPTVAPVGVFMDLRVLSEAPERMIRSGLGDSICRATAQADWLMAYFLRGDSYDETPFNLLMAEEKNLIAKAGVLLKGDLEAMGCLARTLVLSGMGMTVCGGSYPASQGEHLISHYIEMLAPENTPASFHGEQIAVASLVMAKLQERLLAGDTPCVVPSVVNEQSVIKQFGGDVGTACWKEFSRKKLDQAGADAMNTRLQQVWPEIVSRVGEISMSSADIRSTLEIAGINTSFEGLGLERDFFLGAVNHAREIRNRYTFLDLAADSGRLNAEDLI